MMYFKSRNEIIQERIDEYAKISYYSACHKTTFRYWRAIERLKKLLK